MEVAGRHDERLNRKYFDEARIMVDASGADISLMHPGGIRLFAIVVGLRAAFPGRAN